MHFGFMDLISLHGINMFRPLMWPSSGFAVQTVPSLTIQHSTHGAPQTANNNFQLLTFYTHRCCTVLLNREF